MTSESNTNFRKIARDFKGRIELMKKTELQKIESLFLEIYELGLQDYIQKEKKRYPNKSHKEIIIDMYQFHDRLRGGRK
ncbi:hypothetical protein LCGC14_0555870 [marine sediment metagenome]|uniref:Uncharacterized protein n=1 Tax=marine sediment metagenome TaxID=412755 RepID=A0A0F9U9U8_9ZZZZ|nr:hypothetical protein [archaeon]